MIAVAYSLATGRAPQRCQFDPNKGEVVRPAGPGEGILVFSEASLEKWLAQQPVPPTDPLQAYISQATGLIPLNDRYVVVQGTQIVDVMAGADPAMGHLDKLRQDWPGATIVAEAIADQSYTYDPIGKKFIAPVQTKPVVINGS